VGAAFILISSSFSPFFLNASPKLLHIILSYDTLRLVRAAKGRKEIVMALGQVLELLPDAPEAARCAFGEASGGVL